LARLLIDRLDLWKNRLDSIDSIDSIDQLRGSIVARMAWDWTSAKACRVSQVVHRAIDDVTSRVCRP